MSIIIPGPGLEGGGDVRSQSRELRLAEGGTQTDHLADNSVTLAKLQDIATARVLGRAAAGSGDPEELTLSQVLDLLTGAAQGDILYRAAASWAYLAAGTAGQFLQTQGAGADPAWASPSSGTPLWEQIGDSGSLGTVAQVEFTFTAGRYAEVRLVASDLRNTAATNPKAVNVTLRNSGGAVVTLSASIATASAITVTALAEFVIGLQHTTKLHIGRWLLVDNIVGTIIEQTATGQNATAVDRVRVDFGSNNITAGRVMAYGLLATAP